MKILLLLITAIVTTSCGSKSESTHDEINHNNTVDKRLKIYSFVDEMTDEEYYMPSKKIIIVGDEENKAFTIEPIIFNENGKPVYKAFRVKSVGVGTCIEDSSLFFLFEDNTKEQITSDSKFNCNGEAFFDRGGESLNKLIKPITKIRFRNGRSGESLTSEISESDKHYFLELRNALLKGEVVPLPN